MPETTSDRLKLIMEQRGLKQIDILRLSEPYCKKYKIKLGKSDLSQFISGKVVPGQWKLTILGLALNVSEGWLMGLDVPMTRNFCTCPICGMDYLSTVESEIEEHNYFHELFCRAVNNYGFCYPRDSLGVRKSKAYDVLYSATANFSEKCSVSEEILKIYFSRSVAHNGYSLEHPQFDDYAAMLLNQNQFKERFGEDVYTALVQEYGKEPGIPEGRTTYQIEKTEEPKSSTKMSKSHSFTLSEDEQACIKKYRSLDEHGKEAVDSILDVEYRRCQNEKSHAPKLDIEAEVASYQAELELQAEVEEKLSASDGSGGTEKMA